MVFTSSQLKNMSITSEMREYFENLMKPLVTNETLEQLKSFQDELMKKIEDKFKEQNDRIEELESKLAMKQNIIDHLEIKCDENRGGPRTNNVSSASFSVKKCRPPWLADGENF